MEFCKRLIRKKTKKSLRIVLYSAGWGRRRFGASPGTVIEGIMTRIQCLREGNVDLLLLEGVLDDEALENMGKTISALRQQGSKKILWLGTGLEKIETRESLRLISPVRIFCRMGGKIALAEFGGKPLDIILKTAWRRYLNVFKTKEEALSFLDPKPNP
ncbi:MAG: hypothetical protein AB1656_01555 [Candidatus Omnitrophota bacterium]